MNSDHNKTPTMPLSSSYSMERISSSHVTELHLSTDPSFRAQHLARHGVTSSLNSPITEQQESSSGEKVLEGTDGHHVYRFLDKVVGQGTYGEVVLAQRIPVKDLYARFTEPKVEQLVCIKAISKHMMRQLDMEDFVAQEIQIARKLSADGKLSGNISALLDTLEDRANIYMVMEYCAKGSLEQLYEDNCHEPMEEQQLRQYALQMLQTLKIIHEQHGICHRDLQPSNIVLDSQDNVRIIDFGCSTTYDRLSTTVVSQALPEQIVIGNRNFCPPEIIFGYPRRSDEEERSSEYGHSTESYKNHLHELIDVWSCGVVIFQMATGFLPFRNKSSVSGPGDWSDPAAMLVKTEKLYALPDWFDEEPLLDDVKALIRSMLTVDVSKRPSFEDLVQHPFFNKEQLSMTEDVVHVKSQGASA